MVRGVILGLLAFAGAFVANKQFEAAGKDIARYDKIRAMSGDPPFLREQAGLLFERLRVEADRRPGLVRGILSMAVNDLTWNARVRSM